MTTCRVDPWTLDQAAFDCLLQFLDPDRDAAAAKYEDVRRRLLKMFVWRGCLAPDEYVDRTIDRVARRLSTGVEVRVADPFQYFHGVAINVLREHWREPLRRIEPLDESVMPRGACPAASAADDHGTERLLTCLEQCVSRLPSRARTLLLEYHAGAGQIERRRRQAEALGIPLNALRIRVHRIRASVEACVLRGLEAADATGEMNQPRPPLPPGSGRVVNGHR